MTPEPPPRFRFDLREVGGACGDLGTLLPLTLGAIAVAGLAPVPVLLGFGLFYMATAFLYRLPIPVQPMKAVVAVLLVTEVSPSALAASGVLVGVVLLVLGATGWIDRLGRLLPQSVLAGLQLGLGLALGLVALELMAETPALAAAMLLLLGGLLAVSRLPAALIVLGVSGAAAILLGLPASEVSIAGSWMMPTLVAPPTWSDVSLALTALALPQLALTLTNAILLTALIAGDYFGNGARHVTPRRLSLSTAFANLVLPPFGALPMCHGASGLAAHHRFGARTGGAPLMLGFVLIALAALPPGIGLAMLAAIPAAALGALLLLAAAELAFSRRLTDSRPACWPAIAATAIATLALDPFFGLLAGGAAELVRRGVLEAKRARSR